MLVGFVAEPGMPSQRDPPSKSFVTNRAYWLWYPYSMRLFEVVAHFEC